MAWHHDAVGGEQHEAPPPTVQAHGLAFNGESSHPAPTRSHDCLWPCGNPWQARTGATAPTARSSATLGVFEECREGRLEASPGLDGVTQGLVHEVLAVTVHDLFGAFERRLLGKDD